jgi:hypothetical protein
VGQALLDQLLHAVGQRILPEGGGRRRVDALGELLQLVQARPVGVHLAVHRALVAAHLLTESLVVVVHVFEGLGDARVHLVAGRAPLLQRGDPPVGLGQHVGTEADHRSIRGAVDAGALVQLGDHLGEALQFADHLRGHLPVCLVERLRQFEGSGGHRLGLCRHGHGGAARRGGRGLVGLLRLVGGVGHRVFPSQNSPVRANLSRPSWTTALTDRFAPWMASRILS